MNSGQTQKSLVISDLIKTFKFPYYYICCETCFIVHFWFWGKPVVLYRLPSERATVSIDYNELLLVVKGLSLVVVRLLFITIMNKMYKYRFPNKE